VPIIWKPYTQSAKNIAQHHISVALCNVGDEYHKTLSSREEAMKYPSGGS